MSEYWSPVVTVRNYYSTAFSGNTRFYLLFNIFIIITAIITRINTHALILMFILSVFIINPKVWTEKYLKRLSLF